MENEINILIESGSDVVVARQTGHTLALELGFSITDAVIISTAISEIARNMVEYAKSGKLKLSWIDQSGKKGIIVVANDNGPGIVNIKKAMQDGYATGNGLGIGLPGTKRLMDEFEIVSRVGKGTKITIKKWLA